MARRIKDNPYYKYVPVISIRRVVHHLLSLVLTILVFSMAASLATVTGYLNDTGIRKAVENQEFYKSVRENIIAECQYKAIPTLIDEDVFYSVFTKEQIASDVKAYVAENVKGREFAFDLSALQQTLEDAIAESLEENGVTVTSDIKEDVKLFADEVLEIYESNITISYIGSYSSLKGTAKPIAIILFVVALVFTIALLFLMIAMYKFKVIHKTIRMFAYALGGAGLMLTIGFGYLKFVQIGSGLQIIPEYLYDAMQRYIQNGLSTFIFAGVILLIFSLVLAFVSESLRSRVKKNYFERLEANFRESLNEELENQTFVPDIDMSQKQERAKKKAHDEFNRYAMDRLAGVTLSDEDDDGSDEDFDLPVASPSVQDDFTEIQVDSTDDEDED